MNCPYCSSPTKVNNSRYQKKSNSVWRRRECRECHAIWTTEEHLQATTVFKVYKDELVDFAPEKLMMSVYEALRHRKSAVSDAKHLTDTIINKLQATNEVVLRVDMIKATTYEVLKNYDKLAADVYKVSKN